VDNIVNNPATTMLSVERIYSIYAMPIL